MKRLDKLQRHMDEWIAKSNAIEARAERRFRRLEARMEASSAKVDTQLAKTDAQLAKTDAQLVFLSQKLKETRDMLHGFGLNIGTVAEEFFYNAIKERKVLGNIKFDIVANNLLLANKGIVDEFDVVLFNGTSVGIVEVKHKVHPKDILKLYTTKVENFRFLFPIYKDHTIYLGIAGFSIPQSVAAEAKKRGIAVVRQKAETAVEDNTILKAY